MYLAFDIPFPIKGLCRGLKWLAPMLLMASGIAAQVCPGVSTPAITSKTTFPSLTGVPVSIPVNTTSLTGSDVISADFTFTYDSTVLDPNPANISVTPGPVILHPPAAQTAVITYNANTPGTIIVSVFDRASFAGAGALVNINMRVIGQIGTTSPLTLSGFLYNGGLVCANVTSGSLTVVSGSISGRVTYENAAAPVVPVPYTNLNAPGSPAVSDITDLNGDYSLSAFGPGAYTVTPSKANEVYTAPNGIFSDDASRVAQHVVMLIALNPTQQRAAKVSGQASISSFDAALIAQWIVGIPNMINQTGQWKFTPTSQSYGPNINSDLSGQDYAALLMGDVNGDWVAPTTRPAPLVVGLSWDDVRVSLSRSAAVTGAEVTLPVTIDNFKGHSLTSFQFDVEYDHRVIEPLTSAADISGTRADGAGIVSHSPYPGMLKVVVFGTYPVSGDGIYANLRFRAIGAAGSSSILALRSFRFDDGKTPVRMVAGELSIRPSDVATYVENY
jgi:hypothetical protein